MFVLFNFKTEDNRLCDSPYFVEENSTDPHLREQVDTKRLLYDVISDVKQQFAADDSGIVHKNVDIAYFRSYLPCCFLYFLRRTAMWDIMSSLQTVNRHVITVSDHLVQMVSTSGELVRTGAPPINDWQMYATGSCRGHDLLFKVNMW